jgi:IS30 family transposase
MPGQLTLPEREQIAEFRNQGVPRAEIARRLGRPRSTVGRELARNGDGGTYWASRAQAKARARRGHRPHTTDDPRFDDDVRRGLARCWSPERIAGRAARDVPGPRRRVSHTTIYRWIAAHPDRPHWESLLRFGRRRIAPETRGKLPARAAIAGRPAVVDRRSRFGDWEGDPVVGPHRGGGLVTLVERKSGFGLVGPVHRRKARNVTRAATRLLTPLPTALCHTATFDNGKEFAQHQRIARRTGIDVYFARPSHAWERGGNESYNGLLRQFFPKGTDFTGIGPHEGKHVRDLLNDRPRKRHGYRTPREVLGRYFPVAFQL